MAHKYPEKEFVSAFNNATGQMYFKEAIPDLYSPITKQALFMNCCILKRFLQFSLFYDHIQCCTMHMQCMLKRRQYQK